MKPKVFIGSSTRGLKVAEAIQKELSHDAEAILWSQGVFRTINVAIEDLMRAVSKYDFAVFVFLPEDTLNIREKRTISVRDNVLFESGLFLGRLGRERNFFVAPKSERKIDLHLPSDLSGIVPSTYEPRAENLQASVGAALYEIKQSIRSIGAKHQAAFQLNNDLMEFFFCGIRHKYLCHVNKARKQVKKAVVVRVRLNVMLIQEGDHGSSARYLKIKYMENSNLFSPDEKRLRWKIGDKWEGKCGQAWSEATIVTWAEDDKSQSKYTRKQRMTDRQIAVCRHIKSVLSAPVKSSGAVVAVLNMDSNQLGAITRIADDEVKNIFKLAANELALLISQRAVVSS